MISQICASIFRIDTESDGTAPREHTGWIADSGTREGYIVVDSRSALINPVVGPAGNELIEWIQQIIPLAAIRVIVLNHAHRFCENLEAVLLPHCSGALLVTARAAAEDPLVKNSGWRHRKTAKTGDKMLLGDYELTFVDDRMTYHSDELYTVLRKVA